MSGARAREIVESVNRFHAAARSLGVRVIYVKSVIRRNGSDDINGVKSAALCVPASRWSPSQF